MKFAILLILAYILGSFPSGVVIGRLFYHRDIRQYGSGNIGTTNTFRVLGKPAGVVVLLLDILKGALAAALPIWGQLTPPHYLVLVFGLAAILGHSFSIFIKFKGGKAVATSAGILLTYNPGFFVIAVAIFLAILYISSMVSVASMLGLVLITISSLYYQDIFLTCVAFGLTLFIFYRHRENIKRIRNHNENLVPFGWYYHHKK
ncbi:glycerol-3-phosphate 1-O-acyltransferase PlsY [Lapidilactobacillus mulanensis]|uniref:Glycerol-3-phosphate acyltransferase n=1 Tax=Lapidilactobacillus mulanensis TaxID=2485999 RepID=A0ABW4DNL4_9LACO|nr:glycerol-3-phosphate 1-O-acyltransferase PlsY [Lapidilactobacillus mulanensis]